MKQLIDEIIDIIKTKKPSKIQLSKIKTKLSKKYKLKKIPTDIEILLNAPIKEIPKIKKCLVTKPTRTISGVAVCAIMTKPFPCPHKTAPCIYCPGGVNSAFGTVPQSYTGKEPATRRAIRNNYDPYLQVMNRLEQYVALNQDISKVELIIMGGTFPSFQKKYQEYFVTYAFKAMNDFSELFFNKRNEFDFIKSSKNSKNFLGRQKSNEFDFLAFKEFFELPGDIFDEKRTKSIHKKLLLIKNLDLKKQKEEKVLLIKEQLKNEKSNIRCISLAIETRPDYSTLKEANQMLKLGCTKVELGVQTIYNDVLKKIKRGHTVEDSIKATRTLKDLGFKINYHIMPGLPGVKIKQDLFALYALFKYEEFQPDMLKIYPCMVLKGTKLYNLWKKKKYKPLTTKQAADLISEFKRIVPEYCRITRILRDIPTYMTEAGVDRTNLRQYIEQLMKKKKIKCRCIRCRESGHVLRKNKKIKVKEIKILERHYIASGGNEFFISAEDVKNDILFGFCRLRFPSQSLRKEITEDSALIRELHIYSPSVPIGKKSKDSYQHRGLGKKLVETAEKIAKTYYKRKMIVISGIGAKAYFTKLGYKKEGPYMVKKL